MTTEKPIIIVDRREPEAHPWQRWIGDRCELVRGWDDGLGDTHSLPTCDFCLPSAFSLDESKAVLFRPKRAVERKALGDLYSCCVSPNRERFERELMRMYRLWRNHCCWSAVVVEASYEETMLYATNEHKMTERAFEATVKAYEYFAPFVFAGSEKGAAWWSYIFLTGCQDGLQLSRSTNAADSVAPRDTVSKSA